MSLLLCSALLCSESALAQYENEKDATIPLEYFYIKRENIGFFRRVFSKVTFGLSTGYGSTAFKHDLGGYGIIQNGGTARPVIFASSSTTATYGNWVNEFTSSTTTAQPSAFMVNSDTTTIGFKSKSFNIPLRATLHVDFDKVRVGGGFSFEYTHVGSFRPTSYGDKINSFNTDFSSFFLKKYFAIIGGTVYRYNEYLVVVDLNLGGYSLGKQFEKSQIQKGMFINLGVSIEREMSEYFRLFVRPSYEIKSYDLRYPESSLSVTNKLNAFYVNVGATYRIPELRRCFLKTCKAQMNHAHGNREYRSRVHPIYKKQNPHYGENHPNLIKYKGKNKKKLNPY
ncbi:MAG: hypothetical protein QM762_21170 [Chryseolinea sp.]